MAPSKVDFPAIFRQADAPAARGKYLSRVFGIFSEEIVRLWASHPRCTYEDLGRPTLWKDEAPERSTLDFCFREKESGRVFAVELKCEIEFQGYRYLVLSDVKHLAHHAKPAFRVLLDAAARHPGVRAAIKGRPIPLDGAILIWGAATPEGRQQVIADKGFAAVLTMSDIVEDLHHWRCAAYAELLAQRRAWANEMFAALQADPL